MVRIQRMNTNKKNSLCHSPRTTRVLPFSNLYEICPLIGSFVSLRSQKLSMSLAFGSHPKLTLHSRKLGRGGNPVLISWIASQNLAMTEEMDPRIREDDRDYVIILLTLCLIQMSKKAK